QPGGSCFVSLVGHDRAGHPRADEMAGTTEPLGRLALPRRGRDPRRTPLVAGDSRSERVAWQGISHQARLVPERGAPAALARSHHPFDVLVSARVGAVSPFAATTTVRESLAPGTPAAGGHPLRRACGGRARAGACRHPSGGWPRVL